MKILLRSDPAVVLWPRQHVHTEERGVAAGLATYVTSATNLAIGRGIAQTNLPVVTWVEAAVARVAIHENSRVVEIISLVTTSNGSLAGLNLGVRDMHHIDVALD